MRKIKITILMIVLLSVSMIPLSLFIVTGTGVDSELPDYIGVDLTSGLAGNVPMPEFSGDLAQLPSEAFASDGLQTASGLQTAQPTVGDEVYDWYLWAIGYYYGAANSPYMTLRAIGDNVEVWVANDLNFLPGDPRNNYPGNWTITDEMCEYIAEQFDDIIYPTDSEYFGMSQDRDGTNNVFGYDWLNATDNPQRVIIKILNIVDDAYYDPTYPYFVIGFFNSYYDSIYDRNMIHLDAWQWWARLGETGTEWLPDFFVPENHQYDYDSTTAHEYQHLIHSDWQPNPATWMNEGCSMYAEFLCGYGLSTSHVNSFFATPDNSLTIWGDQGDINILADYGSSALWTMYLSDQYGGADIIREYVQSGIPGIDGINAALAYYGFDVDFYDVYHDWRIANLIRSDFPGHGKYNYHSVDLTQLDPIRVYDVLGHTVSPMKGTDFGNTITTLGYDTGTELVPSYGTDYICFTDIRGFVKMNFDGDDTAFYGWRYTSTGEWWTGMAPWYDTVLYGEALVDPENPTLTINTYWDIEDYWDFGFIQVSTDGGATWTSLENEYTTYDHDPDAFPDITQYLPGLTGYSPYVDDPPYPNNDGWITMDFDLTDYAGQTVMIGFRYMTDPYSTYLGWLIDEATVSDTPLNLQVAGDYPAADFMVTLVKRYTFSCRGHEFITYSIDDMHLSAVFRGHENEYVLKSEDVFLLVSSTMLSGEADYTFSVTKLGWKHGFPCGR